MNAVDFYYLNFWVYPTRNFHSGHYNCQLFFDNKLDFPSRNFPINNPATQAFFSIIKYN